VISWEGTLLEGKQDLLRSECQRSSIPDVCVAVIAVQVKYETRFGSLGTGLKYKNLTGIRDKKVWRKYATYEDSIKDTVKLFIDGNYQDYFTIYGLENGLQKYLARWGTNQYQAIIAELR
jgi:hypothetical protein